MSRKSRRRLALTFACAAALACALLLTHSPGGSAQTSGDTQPLIDGRVPPAGPQGEAELRRGDYARAAEFLSLRLKSNPTDAEAQRLLLRAQLETGRYAEAEAAARAFLEKRP